MTEKIKFEVELTLETVNTIDGFVKYGSIKNKYGDYIPPLPETHEEFIKASVDMFIRQLERVESYIIAKSFLKLNSKDKLKNNIKEMMEDKGYLQKDLIKLTGIDQGALSHILSNRNQPSMDYFLRIWIVLGCPPIEEMFYRDK